MTNKYTFEVKIGNEKLTPKGFYYQNKHVIIVGCTKANHTIRRKEKISDVEINVIKNK